MAYVRARDTREIIDRLREHVNLVAEPTGSIVARPPSTIAPRDPFAEPPMRTTEPKSSRTHMLFAPAVHPLVPSRRLCTTPIYGHQSSSPRPAPPLGLTSRRLSLITLPTKEVAEKNIYARGQNARAGLFRKIPHDAAPDHTVTLIIATEQRILAGLRTPYACSPLSTGAPATSLKNAV